MKIFIIYCNLQNSPTSVYEHVPLCQKVETAVKELAVAESDELGYMKVGWMYIKEGEMYIGERYIWAVKTDKCKCVVKDRMEQVIGERGKCVVIEVEKGDGEELWSILG